MKKIILVLAVLATLSACGKTEVTVVDNATVDNAVVDNTKK